MTDTLNRRKTGEDTYQCGCRWTRQPHIGDVLIQCPIHQQATEAKLREIEKRMVYK